MAREMSDWKVWRVIECYGSYTVALVKPEINGRDKVVEYSNKWFGFSEIKEADNLATQLNKRDGLKELYD